MNLEVSVTTKKAVKVQYLHMLVSGEALHQFYSLSADVKSTNHLTVEDIILGLGAYFFPVNFLSKQECAILRVMRKPRGIKLRRYTDFLIDLNEYLDYFPEKMTEKLV